jgi:hypothetical protein
LSAQEVDGWIRVLQPVEWSGETTRGLVVRPKNSIRIEGVAYQPGGVDRVEIDGQTAGIQALGSGQVRFVGYASTDTVSREVEVVAYATGPRPPISQEYAYTPGLEPISTPASAFGADGGFTGERYAVVIGISDYADSAITPLRYADDDAEAFYQFLTSSAAGLGGFKRENIRFLTNEEATTRAIRTALTTFLRSVTERDVVVIYIAGHGSPDPSRLSDYYVLTHDTDARNYPGTAVSMDDINRFVGQIRARDIIMFTDACHSAAVSGGQVGFRSGDANEINDIFLERLQTSAGGQLRFTASETNQFSQEGPQWGGGHGVFTHQLLQGLRGAADTDQDGIVTLGEVVEFTRFSVNRETGGAQIPSIGPQTWDRFWPMAISDPDVLAESIDAPAVQLVTAIPTTTRAVSLMSPGGTFAHSLVVPGSGQFRTGRGIRGAVVLAGSIAAVTYGFMSKTTTKQCREATVGGECLSGQFSSIDTERPDLMAGLVVAGALTVIGAIDAMVGARRVNEERLRMAGLSSGLLLLPTNPSPSSQQGDIRLVEFRFR